MARDVVALIVLWGIVSLLFMFRSVSCVVDVGFVDRQDRALVICF